MKFSKKIILTKTRKSKKKYTLNLIRKSSFYKDFSEIIRDTIVEKYMNQLNSNDIVLEKKIIEQYRIINQNLFYEYRAVAAPSPFPLLNVNKLIDEIYKEKNMFDICVISNVYPQIIPFLSPFLFKKIKHIKIMLYKNLLTTKDPIIYSSIIEILNNIKNSKNIEIEGDYEYDINNYLKKYIEDENKISKKYSNVLIFISYYMELYHSSKLYNYILTGLFNLEKNGTLILYSALLHHNTERSELFLLLTSVFNDYKLIKYEYSDFYYDYTYRYEFYNFKGTDLIKISKLIIEGNTKPDISNIININNKNINDSKLLLFRYINEENKYTQICENFIKYFKYNSLSFIKFIAYLTMNRIFIINNDIHKLKITYDQKNIKLIINEYYKNICCFKDYYREIEQKVNRHTKLSLNNYLHISSNTYDFDIIPQCIFNIDVNKQIYNNCSLKQLNESQNNIINNNINKELLVDIIIKNQNPDQDKEKEQYIQDPSLFVEHLEILNTYLQISPIFNHLHFGKNKQFINSVLYKTQNVNTNPSQSIPVTLISCDDIPDIKIDGYDMSQLDNKLKEDTFISSFYIMDEDERETMNNKLKEFEKYEFNKLYTVLSTLSIGGDCCIKHIALPLNSYLYYRSHTNISGFFINYLYLYLHLFKSITLYKPSITPNSSLEFYVIGNNFLGIESVIQNKLLHTLDNFDLHQTFFKKEDIDNTFIKEVESFLTFMTNRYVDFKKIQTILKSELLEGKKDNPIVTTFLNKKILHKELNTTIFNIWKNKNKIDSFFGLKKLYYFTKFDIPDPTKITFDFTILEKLLDSNDFINMVTKYDSKDVPNSLYFIHTYLHKKNFVIPENTTLINILNVSSLADKDKLYQNCYNFNKSLTNKYFMETYLYDKTPDINYYISLFKNNNPWYIKITNEFAGRGNFIVSSFNEFKNLLEKIEKRKSNPFTSNIIINKYQENPLLFNKKKFHLRIFYIVYINSNGNIKSFLSKYGFIWTAKEDYNPDPKLYGDVKIHDSHSSSTKTDYLFPNDFEKEFGIKKTNLVSNNILNILQFISKVQVNNISTYPNSKNGYIIMGTDFIVDSDFNVKILEINNRTGLYTKHKNTNDFISKYLYENIYNDIISDVFNLKKIKVDEKLIPILH